jgi:hypothetical protein
MRPDPYLEEVMNAALSASNASRLNKEKPETATIVEARLSTLFMNLMCKIDHILHTTFDNSVAESLYDVFQQQSCVTGSNETKIRQWMEANAVQQVWYNVASLRFLMMHIFHLFVKINPEQEPHLFWA